MNPFDLLGDDDAEDPSQLIAARQVAPAAAPKKSQTQSQSKQPVQSDSQAKQSAKLPSKPLPPAQAGEPFLICFALSLLFGRMFILNFF